MNFNRLIVVNQQPPRAREQGGMTRRREPGHIFASLPQFRVAGVAEQGDCFGFAVCERRSSGLLARFLSRAAKRRVKLRNKSRHIVGDGAFS